MRRRTLLLAGGGMILAAAGCGTARPGTSPVALPSGGTGPVAYWRRRGAMMAPRLDNMRPFLLVVYPDGQAISNVSHTLSLTRADLDDLVTRLAGDLSGQPATANPRGGSRVMDAGITIFGVRTTAGEQTVSADGLDELRDARAYPAALYAARDLLGSLADRVTQQGRPYTADRIRLFAGPTGGPGESNTTGGWPSGVPVPTITDRYGVRHVDLAGTPAATVTGSVPPEEFNWSTLRSPTGEILAVSWRFLLPDE
jgi:hypothetical protein